MLKNKNIFWYRYKLQSGEIRQLQNCDSGKRVLELADKSDSVQTGSRLIRLLIAGLIMIVSLLLCRAFPKSTDTISAIIFVLFVVYSFFACFADANTLKKNAKLQINSDEFYSIYLQQEKYQVGIVKILERMLNA